MLSASDAPLIRLARRTRAALLPLPRTRGRGLGRGVSGADQRTSALLVHAQPPLSPTLSTDYRGEGVGERARGNQTGGVLLPLPRTRGRGLGRGVSGADQRTSALLVHAQPPLSPTLSTDYRGEGVGERARGNQTGGVLLPLPRTRGRGLGRGVSGADQRTSALLVHAQPPLSPTLSTDYRGEGVGERARGNQTGGVLLPLPRTRGRGLGRGVSGADQRTSALLVHAQPPLSPTLSTDYRGEGVGERARGNQTGGVLLPLPRTRGRGLGRGVSGGDRRTSALLAHGHPPLSPTLSTDYRGEGVGERARGNQTGGVLLPLPRTRGRGLGRGVSGADQRTSALLVHAQPPLSPTLSPD